MDEINIGPKHDFRLPSRRWLVMAAAVPLIAGAATLIMTSRGGHRGPRAPGPSVAATVPVPSPTAAPGTLLITCSSANSGGLYRDWRAGSLKIGPMWLVGGRHFAYVSRHGGADPGPAMRGPQRRLGAVMIVEVSDGSTVVMKAAGKAGPNFQFVYGFNGPAGNRLPRGDSGFTLSSCPAGEKGPNGAVTDFRLGFLIAAGGAAPVEVQTSASSGLVRLIFTKPRRGDAGSSSTS